MWRKLLTVALLVLISQSICASNEWDIKSDSWTANDALGRSLPGYKECGPVRPDRYVGIFYFLWLGQHGTGGPYDISKILDGKSSWGKDTEFHYWSEPELGYYLSNDDFVIRRHCQMLANAGVDVVIFDMTNGFTYRPVYMKLCKIYRQIRSEGGKTPQICFLAQNVKLAQKLYSDFYSKNLYSELWFKWDRKPLIFIYSPLDGISKQISDFFTIRQQCALVSPNKQDEWGWMQFYPQAYGWHKAGVPEEISVSIAQQESYMSAPAAHGRSYHNGAEPPIDKRSDYGENFKEQWERALAVDPQFIFITGWNEWVAQKFKDNDSKIYFVDTYTKEFSRDIEPMKGGHTDDYYYQMVNYIRRYKGVRAPEMPSAPKTINIDGNFSDWDSVFPEYRDNIGDAIHRKSKAWGKAGIYVNNTGRNDFVKMKVTYDNNFIYFYVDTKDNISSYKDPNWMLLFIDSDCNCSTGWNGYDYLVNGIVPFSNLTTLQRNTGGWNWSHVQYIHYRISGNKMELAVPRVAIGQTGKHIAFDFHWADNIQKPDDITEFSVSGDSAPDRRFNYRFDNEP